jgi:hypothetical protein
VVDVTFRSYNSADCQACTDIFDANCPGFFAPNERQEYDKFPADVPTGYEVCEFDGGVRGAFGVIGAGQNDKQLKWVDTFKKRYGNIFRFEGNRAIVFHYDDEIPFRNLVNCISLALDYHSRKHLPLLGA